MKETKPKGRAPAFQFYADDFLAGTMTMTNEERGAYISLLCLQWSKGFVTELDIQRICLGMPTHCQGICQSKFEIGEDGHYRNTVTRLSNYIRNDSYLPTGKKRCIRTQDECLRDSLAESLN